MHQESLVSDKIHKIMIKDATTSQNSDSPVLVKAVDNLGRIKLASVQVGTGKR